MLNYIITALIGIVAVAGSYFPRSTSQIWDDVRNFGSTNFPTSLDTLTNPSGTDSVATVSHSAQHSNANDAIEAIEAKVGIGASTAISGTVLYGNGTGSSAWSASPSITGLTLSGQGIFGSFISNASSTIVGGLTITGNSTTTNATTTIGAFTNYATSTAYYGAGLTPCIGSSYLTWSNGVYGCQATSVSERPLLGIETTTGAYLASTTAMTAGQAIRWEAFCYTSGGGIADIAFGYKTSNDSATTTVFTANQTETEAGTFGVGVFTATTTYTVTVEAASSAACNNGMEFVTTFYR